MQTKRIRELAKKRGISLTYICKKIGVAAPYFLDIEKSGRTIPEGRLKQIADILFTTPEYLNGTTEDPEPPPGIPVTDLEVVVIEHVATVAAGYSQTADVDVIETVAIPKIMLHGYPASECKMITVKGNSMYPAYMEGDRVVYHSQTSVDSGSIAVVQYNGDEITIKRVIYKYGEDWLRLEPLNPMYPPLEVRDEDLELCRVYGLVISSMRL